MTTPRMTMAAPTGSSHVTFRQAVAARAKSGTRVLTDAR